MNINYLYIKLFSALILGWVVIRFYFYFRYNIIGFEPIAIPIMSIISIFFQLAKLRELKKKEGVEEESKGSNANGGGQSNGVRKNSQR